VSKPDKYYSLARRDLQTLLPENLGRVLEVGCGRGFLGLACKQRGALEVVGIEITEENARDAEKRLNRVLCGDIETMELPFEADYFNTIICADVLEHLRDPWATLRRLHSILHDDGCLVVSIPNVANYTVIIGLLCGLWTYQEMGLLDRTHLRFFTAWEIDKMLEGAGFRIDRVVTTVTDEGNALLKQVDKWKLRAAVRELTRALVPNFDLSQIEHIDTNAFFVHQYIVRAVKGKK